MTFHKLNVFFIAWTDMRIKLQSGSSSRNFFFLFCVCPLTHVFFFFNLIWYSYRHTQSQSTISQELAFCNFAQYSVFFLLAGPLGFHSFKLSFIQLYFFASCPHMWLAFADVNWVVFSSLSDPRETVHVAKMYHFILCLRVKLS